MDLMDYKPTNNYTPNYNTPLNEAAPPFNNNISNIGSNATYRTPKQSFLLMPFLIGIIFGGGVLALFTFLAISGTVKDNSLFYFGYPFILVWMCGFTCIPGCSEFYTSIHINSFLRQIKIKKSKIILLL